MKALKLLPLLPLLMPCLYVSSVFAVDEIDDSDHATLAKHYENLAKSAEIKLQKNKELLQEYEAHPYHYGRQGQDLQSHTAANIHEYKGIVEENLHNAELHKKKIIERDDPVNKAKTDADRDSIAVR
ncbi:hypothetical protein [Nitrosomonas sp. Nm166]|uniref:hypothetical protein n=1 Tax=Nitrosomonas sp. Nm166 TaxID=1881054 RepID=UPI0008F37DAF|nr:hypothetical protein [Nitrosomonas sp. Nm166]SFE09524.1 hypothetical protein SAMN05428977_100697 [Nitrosomonas sp. Nm166]